jgi:hypothetical protein
MKVGDLVELSAAARKLIWTEPFHDTIGILTDIKNQESGMVDYVVRWMHIKKYSECSDAFRRKSTWEYRSILLYSFTRKDLKLAKRRKR